VEFEFDPEKSRKNKAKHRIDFQEPKNYGKTRARLKAISDYPGEQRIVRIGKIGSKIWTVIFTYRSSVIRIISVRRAHNNEQKRYEDFT
jgi:uncharacterized DUF497 family protein